MRRKRLPIAIPLAVAVIVAMGFSIHNGFVYDDVPAIAHNSRVTDPALWHTIPSAPYWQGTLWRPVTVGLFALQWWAGHDAPWLFHLVSLLGYFAVAYLLATFLKWLDVNQLAALLAAAVFVVHPVHVEVVANVVGQAELWVTLAMLGATWIYVHARNEARERASLLPLLLFVAVGIMAKETGFVIPALLFGAEVLLVKDTKPWYRRLELLIAVLLVAGLLFVARTLFLNDVKGEFAAVALRGMTLHQRLLTFLGVVPEYFRLLLWPAHLQADYGPPGTPVGGPFALRHALGLVIAGAVMVTMLATRRRTPLAAFGLWWAIVCFAPLSNILTASGIVMAERALFLPSIGCAMALAAGLNAIAASRARLGHRNTIPLPLTVVLVVLMAAAATRSARRVATWSNQTRFFADLAHDAPTAYRGWKVAGEYAKSLNDHATAVADFQHSIALWPHDEAVFEELGQLYREDGHCDEAVTPLATGIAVKADDSSLRAKLVECLINVGQLDRASKYAADGVALGQQEFKGEQVRIERARLKSDSMPPASR